MVDSLSTNMYYRKNEVTYGAIQISPKDFMQPTKLTELLCRYRPQWWTISTKKSVHDEGWHVGHRQPEDLCIPSSRVASARIHGGDGVLHAADHLHQVTVSQHLEPLIQHVESWKRNSSDMILFYRSDISKQFLRFRVVEERRVFWRK